MANEIRLADVNGEQTLRVHLRQLKRHPAFRACKKPIDLVKESLIGSWRLATYHFRQLPTTVIVGAQKAGTTQLYVHMVKHPRCFRAANKEVNYFSKHPKRPLAWYRSRFPWQWKVQWRQGHVLEASPSYLPTPSALRKMYSVLPNARVVVILRDPVARAFSHYQHKKTRHLESRSFAEAVEQEIRTNAFPAKWGVALADGAKPMWGYVARGYYALQLEMLNKMYRRNRILVLDSANLFADTAATCNRVFDYMGLEDFDVDPSKVYNRGYYKEKIDPRVAERLREHYRPYDEMLAEFIGQPLGWMIPAGLAVAKAA